MCDPGYRTAIFDMDEDLEMVYAFPSRKSRGVFGSLKVEAQLNSCVVAKAKGLVEKTVVTIGFDESATGTGSADNETLTVSPNPAHNKFPSPMADFTVPEKRDPASVIPI